MANYHKVPRTYLGIPNPATNDLTSQWRKELSVQERIDLARELWDTDIFEARLAAAKLLTQARIRQMKRCGACLSPGCPIWTVGPSPTTP